MNKNLLIVALVLPGFMLAMDHAADSTEAHEREMKNSKAAQLQAAFEEVFTDAADDTDNNRVLPLANEYTRLAERQQQRTSARNNALQAFTTAENHLAINKDDSLKQSLEAARDRAAVVYDQLNKDVEDGTRTLEVTHTALREALEKERADRHSDAALRAQLRGELTSLQRIQAPNGLQQQQLDQRPGQIVALSSKIKTRNARTTVGYKALGVPKPESPWTWAELAFGRDPQE